jgi:hypothetical protein
MEGMLEVSALFPAAHEDSFFDDDELENQPFDEFVEVSVQCLLSFFVRLFNFQHANTRTHTLCSMLLDGTTYTQRRRHGKIQVRQ